MSDASYLSFVSGLVSGAAGALVGHPLDTLKVHAQAASPEQLTLRALWRGVSVPVCTAGGIQALALGIFENMRRFVWPHETPTPLPQLAVAGTTCGVCVAFITCPLSRVKVLQQLTGQPLQHAARGAIASGTLYRGLPTAILWESTRGSYMVLYALLKRHLQPAAPATPAFRPGPAEGAAAPPPLPLWARALAGGGANVINFGFWYPLNTVWNVQQSEVPAGLVASGGSSAKAPHAAAVAHHGRARGGGGGGHLFATARVMLEEGGMARFYRGFGYAIVRAGPVAAVIMPCFEILLPRLERAHAHLAAYVSK